MALIIILVLINIGVRNKSSTKAGILEDPSNVDESVAICPVCDSSLRKGERIHSAVYPGENERIVYIYGCPYCYNKTNSPNFNKDKLDPKKVKKRACPVCSVKLKENHYLIGKMWDTEVKTHLRVTGCIKCRKN